MSEVGIWYNLLRRLVAFSDVFTVKKKKKIRALLGFRYKRSNIPLTSCKNYLLTLKF